MPTEGDVIYKFRHRHGRPIHDGDCKFWDRDLCTCGLIHHLMWDPPKAAWFWEERGKHEAALARAFGVTDAP
jgi:hypothetical protein